MKSEEFTTWPKSLEEKYKSTGAWQGITIGDLLDRTAGKYPSKEALINGPTRLTYSQWNQSVNRIAIGLLEIGIKKGDKVIIQLPNIPEFIYVFFALTKIGAVPVNALIQHRNREIGYLLNLTESSGIIVPPEYKNFNYLKMIDELRPNLKHLKHVIVVADDTPPNTISLREILNKPFENKYPKDYLDKFKPAATDVAYFALSGGTTGYPKAIPRTHNDFICLNNAHIKLCNITTDSAFLVTLPVAHNIGLAFVIQSVLAGSKLVLLTGTKTEDILKIIQNEKISVTVFVPTLIGDILNFPDLDKYDLSSLSVVESGGAEAIPAMIRTLSSKIKGRVLNVFGMSEGVIFMPRLNDSIEVASETVGRPCCPQDEVRILDESGKEVPEGIEGELTVRGPHCFRGYFRDPEENKKSFNAEGFFYTGDLAVKRPDGNIKLVGRKKDMIIRGGENISAAEVEEILRSNEKIQDAAVVGMPDARLGEKVCAFIITRAGETITLDEVTAFLKTKNIAIFKFPERIEVVQHFPLTSVSKVDKKKLKEQL